MKRFLALYLGTDSALDKAGWKTMSEEKRLQQQAAGMAAWGRWMDSNQSCIFDAGTPLGKTKRISGQGIADTKNSIVAYVVVQAPSHEAAAELFEKHPHFMIFPGDSVEVMECLPMPRS